MKKERFIHTDVKVWKIRIAALIDALLRRVTIDEEGIVNSSFCARRNNWLTVFTADTVKETQTSITPYITKAKELDYLIHDAQPISDTDYGVVARRGKRIANHRREMINVLQDVNDKVLVANEELIKFRAILESQIVEYLHSIHKSRRYRDSNMDITGSVVHILNTNVKNPAYVEFANHNSDIFTLIKKYEINDNSFNEKENAV